MLVVRNGTDAPLELALPDGSWHVVVDAHDACKLPQQSSSSRKRRPKLNLALGGRWLLDVGFKRPRGPWKELGTQLDWPWNVYWLRCEDEERILVLPKRNMASFLRELDDDLPLSSLMLPGTHQTMALYGWPHSKCQQASLATQFRQGIRVLDVRLSLVDGELHAYHGVWPEKATFSEILATTYDFLDSPEGRSETVVMSVKPEDNSPWFNALVWLHVEAARSRWFLEHRIPRLGEVRGKVVMFSRFGGRGWPADVGVGIHPPLWPDSVQQGFEWTLGNTLVRTQDWYAIPSFLAIPEKVDVATSTLLTPPGLRPTLNISFFSASSFFLALPPTIALGLGWPKFGLGFRGVNDRTAEWLLHQLSSKGGKDIRLRGWALLDYFDTPRGKGTLSPLFVEFNWRGRVPGEEGWPKAM
ncbi:PLC-like phosphodiesterase [Auricularia subglabra TFB-10046 SS5]|nr:PLC-like phosphodiesterase [Auricularia subglabra TFB-10046 SS5]